MRKASGIGIGSHGNRIRSDHMTTWVTGLTLRTPQNTATLAAVESASNQKGARSPILRLPAASVTAREPKDSQIAIPTTNAVKMLGTGTRRMAEEYDHDTNARVVWSFRCERGSAPRMPRATASART
jgi:hypothetical protein